MAAYMFSQLALDLCPTFLKHDETKDLQWLSPASVNHLRGKNKTKKAEQS